MGFNLISRANNHATDYGVLGMLATDKSFDEAGIIHAGTGKSLSQARAPQILSVPAGRIALVALTSAFVADSPASNPFGQFAGRPGVNVLRTTRYAMVSPEQLTALAKIRDSQPAGSVEKSSLALDEKANSVTLFGAHYKARTDPGSELTFSFTMAERDHKEIISAIRQSKQITEFSIVSVHTHEPGNYSQQPPDFLLSLAHEAIDNGADIVIMHGPHQLRGIEIYKGKPIFYSLGNFFFTVSTMQPLTRDEYRLEADPIGSGGHVEPGTITETEFDVLSDGFKDSIWFESAVAVSRFNQEGQVREIQLHPVELNWGSGRDADRGIPRIAPLEAAKRILERLKTLSQPYGTQVDIQNGIGLIRPTT
jgi:poly-gamma-glutamate synthesis protein (capsule biosynthesis protein)